MAEASVARQSAAVVAIASAIMLIVTGVRQSTGLFVAPISETTGIGLVSISFALAVGQFMWGAAQSVFGLLADRYGSRWVLVAGALLLAAGNVLTTFATSPTLLVLAFGVLAAAGAGAGSFSVLIGATARQIDAAKRGIAAGVINAGGSAGQMIFAPLLQTLIGAFGWIAAMYAAAIAALATIPLGLRLAGHAGSLTGAGAEAHTGGAATRPAERSLREQLGAAARDRSYWLLSAGFFTCGFHIAFLVTHLPGEVGLCGLPASVASTSLAIIGLANIAGSVAAGWLGNVMRMKWLLFWVYLTRAVAIALYLAAPRTPLNFYVFSAVLGVTWLSTIPPTAGLVGKLFGVRYLATLFGLAMLSHQFGAFFGAWFGGLARVALGDYTWMWYADMALALLAAVLNLPIRETASSRLQGEPVLTTR
jgi:predicted MFS family arabinose efflux permease